MLFLQPQDGQLLVVGGVHEFPLGQEERLLRIDQRQAGDQPLPEQAFHRVEIGPRIVILLLAAASRPNSRSDS